MKKRTKKAINKAVWIVVSVMVIFSMVAWTFGASW